MTELQSQSLSLITTFYRSCTVESQFSRYLKGTNASMANYYLCNTTAYMTVARLNQEVSLCSTKRSQMLFKLLSTLLLT